MSFSVNKIKEIFDPKLGARTSRSIQHVHLDLLKSILVLYDHFDLSHLRSEISKLRLQINNHRSQIEDH